MGGQQLLHLQISSRKLYLLIRFNNNFKVLSDIRA